MPFGAHFGVRLGLENFLGSPYTFYPLSFSDRFEIILDMDQAALRGLIILLRGPIKNFFDEEQSTIKLPRCSLQRFNLY